MSGSVLSESFNDIRTDAVHTRATAEDHVVSKPTP
jgi:hypothetical protein